MPEKFYYFQLQMMTISAKYTSIIDTYVFVYNKLKESLKKGYIYY